MFKPKEILDFDKVFSDENYNDYIEKLETLPKEFLFKASTFLLSFHHSDSFVNSHYELLSMWFGEENNKIANEINIKINEYIKAIGHEIVIINSRSSLELFESILSIDAPTNAINESEFELLLFKVYLALNQKLNENDELISKTAKSNKDYPELINLAIGMSLPTFDITNYNIAPIFITQILRAIYLFEFLEERNELKPFMQEFYNRFNVDGYKEYLGKIIPISGSIILSKKQGNINLVINKDEKFDDNIDFLSKLSVAHISDEEEFQDDFLYLRANPLLRIDESTFQIIFPLFAIEKNFNGLYFILKEINDNLPKKKKIKLRQLITYDFSEKHLLYKLLDNIYKKKYFKLKGVDINIPGAPDYYIRNGNKVFVFESKDILINAKTKDSYDFNEYENALKEKLYFYDNGKKIKAKAVKQLINFTEKLLTNSFKADKRYKPNSIKIYPIIVLHNRQLDIIGLNNLVNIWFEKEIEKLKEKSLSVKNVRNITIINIDTLIIFQEQLESGKIKLEIILDEYQKLINQSVLENKKFKNQEEQSSANKNSLVSFNMYIFNKYSWTPPKEFAEKAYTLIESPVPNNVYKALGDK